MSRVALILLLLTAYLDIFWECWFNGCRNLLGAQISLLPGLMVYAGLTSGLATIFLAALWSGCLYDCLSINPLGVSVLPLLVVGWGTYLSRDFILRERMIVQVFAGAAGALLAPILTFLLLSTLPPQQLAGRLSVAPGEWIPSVEEASAVAGGLVMRPALSVTFLSKLIVLTISGAVATPIIFRWFDFLNRIFAYAAAPALSFRADREIIRGRR